MSKKYFPNRGSECYCSALANVLVELGDEQTAQEVFDNYRRNRLVSKDGGMHAGLATRALSELTREKYEGMLIANFDKNFQVDIKKSFPDQADTILKIMDEERERGRIKDHTCGIYHSLPAIFCVKLAHDYHWEVYLGGDCFIDNGVKVSYQRGTLDVPAVLEIRRTPDLNDFSRVIYVSR
ncbi:MAG: hypothetical protein RL557_721 [archaeon]|jgi:hypothetical protein